MIRRAEGHASGRLQKGEAKMHQQKVGLLPWKVKDVACVAVSSEQTGKDPF